MTKYSLDEIKQMLEEPSLYFGKDKKEKAHAIKNIIRLIEIAINHHNKLDKADDAEGF